ncbi:unnamed protein product, partial [marine sediment metagenome]
DMKQDALEEIYLKYNYNLDFSITKNLRSS